MVNFICDSYKKSWKFENFFRLNIVKNICYVILIFAVSLWISVSVYRVFCELTQILKLGVAGLLLSTFPFVICIQWKCIV